MSNPHDYYSYIYVCIRKCAQIFVFISICIHIGVQTRSSSKRNRETVFANVDNVKINWGEDAENKDEGRVKLTSKKHRRNAIIPNGVEALAVREVRYDLCIYIHTYAYQYTYIISILIFKPEFPIFSYDRSPRN